MPYGPHVTRMYGTPMSEKRYLGHFVSALRIDCFQEKEVFKERLSRMMGELRNEPPLDAKIPVQVAGDPEIKTAKVRNKKGIPVAPQTLKVLQDAGAVYGIELIIAEVTK